MFRSSQTSAACLLMGLALSVPSVLNMAAPVAFAKPAAPAPIAPAAPSAPATPAPAAPAKAPEAPLAPAAPAKEEKPAAPAAPAKPVIKLVEPGAEPRKAIRYKLTKGTEQLIDNTTDMAQTMAVGEMKQPTMELPTMTIYMKVKVVDVKDDQATITADIVGNDIAAKEGGNPMMITMMKQAFDGMTGTSLTVTMSDRGEIVAGEIKVPEGAEPVIRQQLESIQQSLGQLAMPFPQEPIGQGAKWSVTTNMNTGGIDQVVVYTVTLDKVEGDKVMLTTAISSEAGKQEAKLPGMPPDMKAELQSLKMTGSGSQTSAMGLPLPAAAASDATTDVVMVIDAPGNPAGAQELSQNIRTKLGIAPGSVKVEAKPEAKPAAVPEAVPAATPAPKPVTAPAPAPTPAPATEPKK